MSKEISLDMNKINPVYDKALYCGDRHLVMVGGAGSGKSYFAADKIIYRLITERDHRFIVFRKVAATIKRSVFQLMIDRLSEWDILSQCTVNRSDFTIEFMNGNTIWFAGLDDQEKLKSIQGVTGAWVEEATELTEIDLTQINLRLRGDTANYKQIMYTFNPISVKSPLKKRFFDSPPESCTTLRTTYQHNMYIDAEYKAEIENLISQSQNLYNIYALGKWGILEGVIFHHIECINSYPEEFNYDFYGLDFGYKHPMALIKISELDGDLYTDEFIYESEMTIPDLIARMESLDINKSANIQCDGARPEAIAEIQRAGFYNCKACPKGAGSVNDGIDLCLSKTIYTKPDNVNFNKEQASYSWRKDREGNPMDEPVKAYDDAMDAMRYAIFGTYGKPTIELENIDRSQIGF